MKTHILIVLAIVTISLSCEEVDKRTANSQQTIDTIPPIIILAGKKIDTAYLQISSTTLITTDASGYTWLPGNTDIGYNDPGVSVIEEMEHKLECTDIPVEISGEVNNKFPGVYILSYNSKDRNGNCAATVTRTVHVVENNAAFLNGSYNVACSCTATAKSSPTPTITTTNYTANVIASGKVNNNFEVHPMLIGPEYDIETFSLYDNSPTAGFFGDNCLNGYRSLTICNEKNAFIVESTFYPYSPAVKYWCKNVYTKQLVLK